MSSRNGRRDRFHCSNINTVPEEQDAQPRDDFRACAQINQLVGRARVLSRREWSNVVFPGVTSMAWTNHSFAPAERRRRAPPEEQRR